MTLLINGQFEPYPQEEIVDLCNTDISNVVIVRALMSETGRDSGIVLESALRFPIAFLNTGEAVGADVARNGGGRRVPIFRASAFTEREGYPPSNYFAVAKVMEANTVVLARGGDPAGPPTLTVYTRAGSCNMTIADAAGKLIASVEPRRNGMAGCAQHILHVEYDVDVALVLCAVIATSKLKTGSSASG